MFVFINNTFIKNVYHMNVMYSFPPQFWFRLCSPGVPPSALARSPLDDS